MKFKSPLLTEASGSIAGLVFSHNAAGLYIRARAVPVNPRTERQELVRQAFSLSAADWVLLGDDGRARWDTYALNTPLKDALGRTLILTGRQMFTRTSVFYLSSGKDSPADAPDVMGLAMLTKPSVSWDEATQKLVVNYTNDDTWATNSNGFLSIFVSRLLPVTRNYWVGPFRYLDRINGSSPTPPTSPKSFSLPYGPNAPSKVFVRFRCADGDRRLSNEVILSTTVTPPA